MSANPKIAEFIEGAKTGGVPDETLVGILTARGWPEKDVYEALAGHYERLIGIEIPRRSGGSTAARDAFFYFLVFSTLATWTIGLGSLAFTLIDRSLVDALSAVNSQYDTYSIAGSLASILVAFPIYLFVSRIVVRESRSHPEKLSSPVRKWLTYLALVIAAGCFIGDLITILTYFLRGEITSRFIAKALVVLVLSGGVFSYYYGGLRKTDESGARGRFGRDSWMAALAALAVVAMIAWGFSSLGAPKTQRTLRADATRVQDLYLLGSEIHNHWNSNPDLDHKLPAQLVELANFRTSDPVTGAPYEYHVKGGSQYELCATFSLPSPQDASISRPNIWSHPAGHYCFSMDATRDVENPNLEYYLQE
ncbi:MAG: DUF5671 domain-containing protein [Candidatus Acidiferrales bacterium]